MKLSTTIGKIQCVSNLTNKEKIGEFLEYLRNNGSSNSNTHQNNNLKAVIESEIWEKDELLSIIKYEVHTRNKADLTLFWDINRVSK
jgi:hypothetical protein